MDETENNYFNRTLTLIKHLYQGKTLLLNSGYTLAMGKDNSIGYLLYTVENGDFEKIKIKGVSGDLTFKDVYNIVKSENLIIIENGRGRTIVWREN